MHLHLRRRRPPWWTRSGYIEQVRDIAPGGGLPGGLKDRDAELAELDEFCAGDEEYLWWKAGPWAGKSALLSTFVLNPPPQSEVVSFFITARLAAQSDSTAFTDALIDQLSAMVGESVPLSLSPAARDAHRRALLQAATDKVRGEGRRLVLIVDGLDEDRGGHPGSGLASVASLLPKVCGEALQVVVASRSNPRLPGDVPADHPLRRCRVRELDVSEHAVQIADLARQELQELLHGDQSHQDVLGLITACGGGLTLNELEELTGLVPYRLEGLLGGVFGRTVVSRVDHAGAVSPRLYLFAHETLRETATQSLGRALGSYRDRLHSWAERYHQQNWPPDTPQYLLRGYTRMLTDLADTDRLVALAVDPVRHDRMLDLSGGDAGALAEIKTAQDLLLPQPEPDLYAMARLSINRSNLETRNANIPTDLPAVWAALGQFTRAEALANGITDPARRLTALAAIAQAVASSDTDRARHLAEDAEVIARTITNPSQQAQALIAVAEAVAGSDPAWAETIARSITDPPWQRDVLVAVARAVAGSDPGRARQLAEDAGAFGRSGRRLWQMWRRGEALGSVAQVVASSDTDRARQLAEDAVAFARRDTDPFQRARALLAAGEALAALGDRSQALRLAADVEAVASTITDSVQRADTLTAVAKAVAASDAYWARRLASDAEAVSRAITDPSRQGQALVAVVRVVAGSDPGRAEAIARAITAPSRQADALTAVARAVADSDTDRARQLVEDAEVIARSITNPYQQVDALTAVARAVARSDPGRAEAIARAITDPSRQADALTAVARAVARSDPGRAEAIARSITDPLMRTVELVAVAGAMATHDPDRAEAIARAVTDPYGLIALLGDAEAAASSDPYGQIALLQVARAVASSDPGRAEAIAHSITDPHQQADALAAVAKAVTGSDIDRARQLAADAEVIARSVTNPHQQADALAAVAKAVTGSDIDRARQLAADAEVIARSVTNPYRQARALTAVAKAMANSDPDMTRRLVAEVEAVVHTIVDRDRESWALAALAEAMTAVGDCDQAEQITRTITDPIRQVRALAAVAKAVAANDPDRAKAIARSVANPFGRAQVLTALAKAAGMPHAGPLLSEAFAVSSWLVPLPVLAVVQPRVAVRIADEVLESLRRANVQR
ncbi:MULTISPECIES: hypothetical protein [Streptomyces]|uniref:hypothetical protein n=1 Tax=Streptomyces TaxID=1883 RepID=UPI00287F50F3|nr:hypothetical protein [Streptomyces sp. CGMCC 4.1456]WNF67250.1 hypothetical protein RJD14_33885 [Streptomyces sp. CGMCC 4.1456]